MIAAKTLSWKRIILILALLLPSASVSVARDDVASDVYSSKNISSVSVNTSSTDTSGNVLPPMESVSLAQGSFVQRLMVGDGKTFDEVQINLFQSYYTTLTVNYAPTDVDVSNGEIVTTCIINNLEIVINTTSIVTTTLEETPSTRHLRAAGTTTVEHPLELKRQLLDEEDLPVEALDMEFTMSYESQYLDVTNYDSLFQTWINTNLATVVEQLQVLSLNITEVQAASRLVEPDATSTPTILVAQTLSPSGYNDDTDAPTESPTISLPIPPKNENGLVIILSSLFVGICIVVAGLLVYWKQHRTIDNNKRHRKRRSTDEISDEDVETAVAANIRATRIQEPTPSSSSTSSKDDSPSGVGDSDKERDDHRNKHGDDDDDDADETPTCGEHYDDWVHHYFKTKNEKKERKKKRRSSLSRDPAAAVTTTKIITYPSHLQDSEIMDEHVRSGIMPSGSIMNTSLQRLEEQRDVLSEQEYEDRRREILLAALQ
jgi:hypothetical protein